MRRFETKKAQKLRVYLSFAFLFLFYVPFCIHIFVNYDVYPLSLSRIGWRMDALWILFTYTVTSALFMLHQLHLCVGLTGEKNKLFKTLVYVGTVFFLLTAVVPFREQDTNFVLSLHTTCGYIGSFSFAFAITYLLCRHRKKCALPWLPPAMMGALWASLVIVFIFNKENVTFELAASLGFMLVVSVFSLLVVLKPVAAEQSAADGTSQEQKAA